MIFFDEIQNEGIALQAEFKIYSHENQEFIFMKALI